MLHYVFSIPFFISLVYSQIVNINVGQNGNAFTPTTINATVGNTVVFTWFTGIHNVVQTNDNSCTNITTGGFTSGPAANQPGKTFNFTVTKPGNIWYACQIHCGSGMKGLIVAANATEPPPITVTPTNLPAPTSTPTSSGTTSIAVWTAFSLSIGVLVMVSLIL